MDNNSFTARQVKYFTARDSYLSQFLTYVQNGWSDQVHNKELKPYWHTEILSHNGCQVFQMSSTSSNATIQFLCETF